MTVSTRCLFEAAYVPAVEASAFTNGGRVILDKLTSYANAAGDVTLRIVVAAGAAGASNTLAKKTFAAGEAYTWPELVGQTLEPNDFISMVASVASSITLRVSGRVVT